MILTSLFLLLQVGPDPMGIELEPLPIPRSAPQAPANESASRDMVEAAVATAILGNEAILAGDYQGAVGHFEAAQVQALAAGRSRLAADIGLDRARALGLLGRHGEAAAILEDVRMRRPEMAEGWTASAMVARNLERLDEAQTYIERAAEIAPTDPAVGLEAGAIAFYAGDTAAAHKSWQSVVDLAPESDEAMLAHDYISRTQGKP